MSKRIVCLGIVTTLALLLGACGGGSTLQAGAGTIAVTGISRSHVHSPRRRSRIENPTIIVPAMSPPKIIMGTATGGAG